MCGINGVNQINEPLLAAMNLATAHRGPDGHSVSVAGNTTFGHNRLAIIDLSNRSNQPMTSNDGRYVIVFNGEIYNYRELRHELESRYTFKTEGDTEVLLAAYSAWGEAMLARLRGIFAFAILDTHDNSLLLARDHAGVKPLYYAIDGTRLVFSSELKGLIAAGYTTLSRDMVALYLSMQYVPSPYTLINGVKKLQPGEVLRYKNGTVEYAVHSVPPLPKSEVRSTQDIIADAVKHQLISDRSVGLFLSGGLDSSIILHHAAQELADVRTFSLAFELDDTSVENAAKFNFDAETAAHTAKHYGTKHTAYTLTHKEVAENIEVVLGALDEPVANPTALTKYMLSQWVRDDDIVVALGGDGGDEVFKGYPRYRWALGAEYFQKLPASLQSLVGMVYPRAKKLTIPLGPGFHAALVTNSRNYPALIRHDFDVRQFVRNLMAEKYQTYAAELTGVRAFMAADRHLWLPDESLHTSDRASMAHGLEYRVPFLDQLVMAHAETIPLQEHVSFRTGKKVLRHAYRDLLPEHLFVRRKRGWLSPAAKWYRNPLIQERMRAVMSNTYSDRLSDMIDWSEANRLLSDHVAGRTYAVNPLWNLLQLQIWVAAQGLLLE